MLHGHIISPKLINQIKGKYYCSCELHQSDGQRNLPHCFLIRLIKILELLSEMVASLNVVADPFILLLKI